MREYGFSLTYVLPYKNRIYESVLIRENTGLWKPVFSHILCSVRNWVSTSKTCKAVTAQKMKFSIKDFFSKCDQSCSFLRIWSHLPKKSLMENFIFCAVRVAQAMMPFLCHSFLNKKRKIISGTVSFSCSLPTARILHLELSGGLC